MLQASPSNLSHSVRYHMVRTCLEQLELSFKPRSWKLGPIPPDPVKLMRVGGHMPLVTFSSLVIAAQSDCKPEELVYIPLLGDNHDGDETYLGDVSWPQHRFSIRKKVEARAAIFQGLKASSFMVPLLNRLDEKNDENVSLLIQCHEDGHQVASLLEVMAYVSAGMAAREDFKFSIDTLRNKLYTPVGTQLFVDLERLTHLPVRSGVNWEGMLWHQLGFPTDGFKSTI